MAAPKDYARSGRTQLSRARRHAALSGAGLLFVVVGWFLVSISGRVDQFFVPPPHSVAEEALDVFGGQAFWINLALSMLRIWLGFVLAAAAALPVGLLMGRSRALEALLGAPISFIRFIPMPAVIPLLVLWFGSGNWGNAAMIALGVFFQLVLMVSDEVRDVRREYMEMASTLGASIRQRLRYFVLPAAAPGIFDAMRITFGLAWATLVFAEMLGASSGLGYDILRSQRYLLVPRVFVVIFTIGTLGVVTDALFALCHQRLFPWSERLAAER